MRSKTLAAGLCGSWLCLSAAAAAAEVPRLPYDLSEIATAEAADASRNEPGDPAATARQSMRGGSYFSADVHVALDTNITNQTGLPAVDVIVGDETVPIVLDPAFRERAGFGQGLAVSGGLRLPVEGEVAAALDADAQVTNYAGGIADDISLLLAFGPEVTFDSQSQGAVQVFGYGRSFGGVIAMKGYGIRGRYQTAAGDNERVYLYIDARAFESGYGEEFGGGQVNVYLTYEDLLTPDLSLSASVYGRREWLGADAFSNYDFGTYGGLSAFLGKDLKGGFTLGLSRVLFDDPLVFYSPDPRRDWRYSGSLWFMPREAVGPGLWPSISYSYTQNASTLQFYRTDRHRIRLGVARYW